MKQKKELTLEKLAGTFIPKRTFNTNNPLSGALVLWKMVKSCSCRLSVLIQAASLSIIHK